MDKPAEEEVLARDVVPYEWGLWCQIEDGKPFSNTIEVVSWSDDGTELVFMLGSHNFYRARPDHVLRLARHAAWGTPEEIKARRQKHAAFIAAGPQMEECDRCHGAGSVRSAGGMFG